MKFSVNSVVAATVAVAGMAMASHASAMIAPFGGASSGTDPLGQGWSTHTAFYSSVGAWGEPGLGDGTLTFNPAGNTDVSGHNYATEFDFIFLRGVTGAIDQSPSSLSGYEETTRLVDVTKGVQWIRTFTGGDEVSFFAPAGSRLDQGDEFYLNVVFTGPVNVDHFSFAGLWTDVAGGVPEPATWAMMLAGFGLVGATLRGRKGVLTAA